VTTPPFTELLFTSADHIATIVLNREHRKNALTLTLINELIHALERADADPDIGAIILTGAGDCFSAGADLKQMGGASSPEEGALPHRGGFVELNLTLAALGTPVIARVKRFAIAGGLGLMSACHFVIAEEDAQFSTPEIDRGLFPMMIMASIFRNVPRRKGLELVLLGRRFGSGEAVEMGLINEAVPAATLDARVQELAIELAAKPPNAMRLGLQAFARQGDMALEEALPYLQEMLGECFKTPDFQEGIQAFLAKRPPQWRSPGPGE
jgi:enoyl-CoA hydratase/carnithine racemase